MNTQRWQQVQQQQSQKQHCTNGASKIKVKIEIEESGKGMKGWKGRRRENWKGAKKGIENRYGKEVKELSKMNEQMDGEKERGGGLKGSKKERE